MLPTAKLTVEKRSSSRRPKISLSDAMRGWNTDEKLVLAQPDDQRKKSEDIPAYGTRYAEPIQKASTTLALRVAAMFWEVGV